MPAIDVAGQARLHGLDERTVRALQASATALRQRDLSRAIEAARIAAAGAPDHPEVLRRLALALAAAGPSTEAVDLIGRAATQRPDDAVLANAQGIVLQASGRQADAIAAFRRACELAPESAEIALHLANALSTAGAIDAATAALERIVAAVPEQRAPRIALVEMLLRQRARIDEGIAHLRELLRRDPGDAWTWSALGEIEQVRFSADELAALARLRDAPQASVDLRVRAGFALARAYEQHGDAPEAFAAYVQANDAMRRLRPWDAAGFSREVDAILSALERPVDDGDAGRGAGVVFIVGLPRAGSTLLEQILACHPAVAAGGERIELRSLIDEESVRRGAALAQWARAAAARDWRRLGDSYLERIATARGGHAVFTDKLPGNWLWLGAALAMLPGARVVDCRRDRLETAWACYRRLFTGGGQDFSYDFGSIAHFLDDYESSMRQWQTLHPDRIRAQHYEALVADAETEVRALLAFCGLDFDPACLRFYDNPRDVRTISSTQVREPLRRNTARALFYGALLDPLRAALGIPVVGVAR